MKSYVLNSRRYARNCAFTFILFSLLARCRPVHQQSWHCVQFKVKSNNTKIFLIVFFFFRKILNHILLSILSYVQNFKPKNIIIISNGTLQSVYKYSVKVGLLIYILNFQWKSCRFFLPSQARIFWEIYNFSYCILKYIYRNLVSIIFYFISK